MDYSTLRKCLICAMYYNHVLDSWIVGHLVAANSHGLLRLLIRLHLNSSWSNEVRGDFIREEDSLSLWIYVCVRWFPLELGVA